MVKVGCSSCITRTERNWAPALPSIDKSCSSLFSSSRRELFWLAKCTQYGSTLIIHESVIMTLMTGLVLMVTLLILWWKGADLLRSVLMCGGQGFHNYLLYSALISVAMSVHCLVSPAKVDSCFARGCCFHLLDIQYCTWQNMTRGRQMARQKNIRDQLELIMIPTSAEYPSRNRVPKKYPNGSRLWKKAVAVVRRSW